MLPIKIIWIILDLVNKIIEDIYVLSLIKLIKYMKKIIFLSLIIIISSCSNNIDKNIIEKNLQEDWWLNWIEFSENKIEKWVKLTEEEIKKSEEIEKKINNEVKKNQNNNIEELSYKEIINYWKIENLKITKKFLENDIYINEENNKKDLFIDFWFSNDVVKLKKILRLVFKIAIEWKIESFTLHCNDINFDSDDLKILKNLKVDLLSLDENCWFKKTEFNWIWYDKKKFLNFFKSTIYIKEIHIWHIVEDYYKKTWNNIEFSSRNWDYSNWEIIK